MHNLISLVTAFKKFKGVFNTIQKSAMYSWQANDLHVVVPANEVDTESNCTEFSNITVIKGVKRGLELGYKTQAPIIKDLIDKALSVIKTPMVGFLNADIILLEDFADKCDSIFERYGFDIFIVGSRFDIRLNYLVNSPDTYKQVHKEKRTLVNPLTSSDLIITSKFMWRKIIKDMPEFIMGRYYWDNWIHIYAKINNLKKFNATDSLVSLHCIHNYDLIKKAEGAAGRDAPSSKYNFSLFEPALKAYGRVLINHWKAIDI